MKWARHKSDRYERAKLERDRCKRARYAMRRQDMKTNHFTHASLHTQDGDLAEV